MEQEFDVVVIGAGPGGYVAAIRLAQLGLKTACVERRFELGGTCLNVGCIPSKTLLHASHEYDKMRGHIGKLGIEASDVRFSLSQMMQRKREIITSLSEGIRSLFKKNKITLFTGSASFTSSHEITIAQGATSQKVRGKYFVIATGSEPTPLSFLPFDEGRILSSTGALSIPKVPASLVVIGAGVIGVELGSVFSRLGSAVHFVEFLDTICPAMDSDVSKGLLEALKSQGMKFDFSTKVVGADVTEKGVVVKTEDKALKKQEISADAVLVAIGRRPFTEGLCLDRAGVALSDKKGVIIDSCFRTNVPHIYAIGDIVDGPMLAHKASEEGVAVAEIIAGHHPMVDYPSIPNVIYTHPEAASVGLTTKEASALGLEVKSASYSMRANSRARSSNEEVGFVKVIAHKDNDKLLGVHILSAGASEMISVAALAIKKRMTSSELGDMCFAHPTMSEAIKEAALSISGRAIHK